ncbi:NAD(P)H-dependent oxidoreductase subunit E [Candidatus Peregrinibacteria bacterium]|nr:MAG: NAD(P)H-dependent oxidoreductase subunit E [Candidatus Peregrinibacteria bacterium]
MKVIKICQAGSCQRNFATNTLKKAEETLGIKAGENTPDGKLRLETCGCLSNCDFGPNVYIGTYEESPLSLFLKDGKVENHMTPSRIEKRLHELKDETSGQSPPSVNPFKLPNL